MEKSCIENYEIFDFFFRKSLKFEGFEEKNDLNELVRACLIIFGVGRMFVLLKMLNDIQKNFRKLTLRNIEYPTF